MRNLGLGDKEQEELIAFGVTSVLISIHSNLYKGEYFFPRCNEWSEVE